jgi:hypothetical protein
MDSAAPLEQAQLLAEYADLRQRAAALEEQVPAWLQRVSDKLHRISGESELADHYRGLLVSARGYALVSIENYHQAIPYLQTAGSLIGQLEGEPAAGGAPAPAELLERLDELIDAAVRMIGDAEQCFVSAKDPDPETVPQSILDDSLRSSP